MKHNADLLVNFSKTHTTGYGKYTLTLNNSFNKYKKLIVWMSGNSTTYYNEINVADYKALYESYLKNKIWIAISTNYSAYTVYCRLYAMDPSTTTLTYDITGYYDQLSYANIAVNLMIFGIN